MLEEFSKQPKRQLLRMLVPGIAQEHIDFLEQSDVLVLQDGNKAGLTINYHDGEFTIEAFYGQQALKVGCMRERADEDADYNGPPRYELQLISTGIHNSATGMSSYTQNSWAQTERKTKIDTKQIEATITALSHLYQQISHSLPVDESVVKPALNPRRHKHIEIEKSRRLKAGRILRLKR